jgi:DNA-binding SARP family transcriptional activator/Flp pilus assembly protein TadD
MALYRLSLLGSIGLVGPAGPLSGRTVQRRRLAILALLGSAPDWVVSRDRVMALLWPESPPGTARHLLSDSLYVLRQSLGSGAILATGEELRLAPDRWEVDAAAVGSALQRRDWTDALARYRGDFLEGFFVRDAVEFERWVEGERARLRAAISGAASALAESLEAAGEDSAAVIWRHRALQLSPYDERVFRRLLDLLIRLEDRGSALEVTRDFLRRMAADLGGEPSEQTRAAIAAVLPAPDIVGWREQASLRPPRQEPGADVITRNLALQARQLWHQRTPTSLERAITYFQRALERDPRYAPAWLGLADVHLVLGGRFLVPGEQAIREARRCIEQAVAIEGDSPESHVSKGGVQILERRWREAEASLRRALALNPSLANAHHWLALAILTGRGNLLEAVEAQETAARLNPLAPMMVSTVGWHRYLMGEFERSREAYQKAVDLDYGFDEGHAGLARVAAQQSDLATVLSALAHGRQRRPDLEAELDAELAGALAVMGDKGAAREAILRAEGMARPLHVGAAWAAIGEQDRALHWLGQDKGTAWWTIHLLRWDRRLDPLRSDPRFAAYLAREMNSWGVQC